VARKRPRTDLRGADADVLQIVALQSRDPVRVRQVLDPRNPLSAAVLPHAIPLLGVRALAGPTMQALQVVADRQPGALIDVLLDPSAHAVVRRRLARVLSVCRSQSVVEGLLLAAEDPLAGLRVQAVRSLFRIRQRSVGVRVDGARVVALARAELAREPTDLRHVFTLLSFVVPIAPLRAAYRGLRGDDAHARGTALEYLHGVLPKEIRLELMAKLENPR
jgi:hypothetical protein